MKKGDKVDVITEEGQILVSGEITSIKDLPPSYTIAYKVYSAETYIICPQAYTKQVIKHIVARDNKIERARTVFENHMHRLQTRWSK